jgi:SnoaL-like domain
MSTSNVTSNLAGHLAVRDLLDRYTDAINEREWVTLAQLFTDNGIWDLRTVDGQSNQQFEGGQNVADGIRRLVETTQRVIQMNHAQVIQVDGRHASARSTIQEVSWMTDGTSVVLFGTYHDAIIQEEDGEWRFAKRQFRMKHFEALSASNSPSFTT